MNHPSDVLCSHMLLLFLVDVFLSGLLVLCCVVFSFFFSFLRSRTITLTQD